MNNIKIILSVFILVFSLETNGQTDSLQICNRYLDNAQQFFLKSNYIEGEREAFNGWELSQKIGNELAIARSCFLLSECERNLGKDADAFEFAIRGKLVSEGVSDVYYLANHLSLLRVLQKMELWSAITDADSKFNYQGMMSFGDRSEITFSRCAALQYSGHSKDGLNQLIDFETKNNSELIKNGELNQKTISKIVECARLSGNWTLAEKYCDKLNTQFYNKVDKMRRIRWNGWKSECLMHRKAYNEAIEFYNRSLQLCSASDDRIRIPILINIAECYYEMSNWVTSQQILDQALEMSERIGDYYFQALCNVFYSAISNQKGWLNYSIEYAQNALSFAEKANDLEMHYEMHHVLSKYQAINGKTELALFHQQEASKLKQEILNKNSFELLANSERLSTLTSKEYWIKSDVEGQRNRRRASELKIQRTQQESARAEQENRKKMDDIQKDLRFSESQREKDKADAELVRVSQENIIKDLEIARRQQENESLILENEANKKELELRISEAERARLSLEDEQKSQKINEQQKERTFIVVASLILLLSLIVVLFFFRSLKKKNDIIKIKNDEINSVNLTLNEKNHEIISGIEYASKFQTIVFPTESDLKKHIEGAFILHKPLELVSGDLPFVLKEGNFLYVAAVDCIGHGVAASMLSIMSYFNLSEIIRSKNFANCSNILMELHRRLEVRSNEVKVSENNFLVSIDLALIKINLLNNEIQFSGANLPLIIQSSGGVEMIKGNSFSIGEHWSHRKLEYTDYHHALEKGDRLFVFSDGFFHQFGGLEMKQKLSKKRTAEWISNNAHLPIGEMKFAMNELFEEWKGDAVQTDDVVFIGLEI